ncbi:MAG: Mur ligase family protein, partial [Candidatus Nanopelagicales bacterium]
MDLRPHSDGVSLQRVAATVGARIQSPIHGVVDSQGVDESPDSVSVYGISVDSRHVQPGDLFAALPGEHVHGGQFAEAAVSAGAVALLTDSAGARIAASLTTSVLVPVLVTDAPRDKVGAAASHIYGNPSADLLLFAVTGTNGKTTTTWLLEAGLRGAGHVTGLVGTVETRIAGEPVASVRTTPEAPELHALLAVMRERGVTAVAIEVSSHALALGRVDGCMFDVAGFTQFGSDHLDFHQTPADYFAAKARLFTPDHATCGVVCVDTPGGQRIVETSSIPTQSLVADPPRTVASSVESDEQADWIVTDTARESVSGFSFQLHGPGGIQLDAGV